MEENKRVFMSNEIAEISAALTEFQCAIEHPKLEKEVSDQNKIGFLLQVQVCRPFGLCEGCHTGSSKASGLASLRLYV